MVRYSLCTVTDARLAIPSAKDWPEQTTLTMTTDEPTINLRHISPDILSTMAYSILMAKSPPSNPQGANYINLLKIRIANRKSENRLSLPGLAKRPGQYLVYNPAPSSCLQAITIIIITEHSAAVKHFSHNLHFLAQTSSLPSSISLCSAGRAGICGLKILT